MIEQITKINLKSRAKNHKNIHRNQSQKSRNSAQTRIHANHKNPSRTENSQGIKPSFLLPHVVFWPEAKVKDTPILLAKREYWSFWVIQGGPLGYTPSHWAVIVTLRFFVDIPILVGRLVTPHLLVGRLFAPHHIGL